LHRLANSTMITLTECHQREKETVREEDCEEAKRMKLLTLHIHGCHMGLVFFYHLSIYHHILVEPSCHIYSII